MAVSVVSFSFSRAAQPEAQRPSSQLDDGFLYCILSATGLQNSIGGPEGPFRRVWLSLTHLVCNFSGPQLIGGPEGPLGLAWLSLQHIVSNFNSSGAPRAPSTGLSLPHLISNFSGSQLNRGPRGPLRPGVAFLTTSRLYNSNSLTSCFDCVI